MSTTDFRDTEIYEYLNNECKDVSVHIADFIRIYHQTAEGHLEDFKTYTAHGWSHVFNVFDNIFKILGECEFCGILKCWEYELLLKSVILHDAGLIRRGDEKDISVEEIRDNHHLRGRDFVNDYYEELGLIKTEAEYIGIIIEAHRVNVNINSVLDVAPINGNAYRLKLLAGILRLADELDVSQNRTSEILKALYVFDTDTEIHHRLCEDTPGLYYLKLEKSITIVENITFIEEERFLENRFIKIKSVYKTVKTILLKEGVGLQGIYEMRKHPDNLSEKELEIKKMI